MCKADKGDKRHIKTSASFEAMASTLPLLLLALCSLTAAQSTLRVFNLRATGLPTDIFGTTDGYVKVFIGSTPLGKTATNHNNPNPWWDEEFAYVNARQYDMLKLELFDSDLVFDDLVGSCQRQIEPGTFEHVCYLEDGGTLHYAYTLS